jgi:vitamin B12 transporter
MISHKTTLYRKPTLVLAVAAALTSGQALAEGASPKLEEMTVTASRVVMPLRQVGASVSVLTEEELEQKNYPILAEALRTLPSVNVDQSGGLGKATSVRIRGEEAHRTLLLIDGINVTDVSTTQAAPHFGHILNSQFERVEVLRGPQGMMYGADAGGVISLFSKQSEEPFEGDVAAEVGSYDTYRVNGNVRGKVDRLQYSLTAADLSSDGFNVTEADPTEDDDGYDNTTLHGTANYAITDEVGVGAVVRDVDASSQFDLCGWPPSYDCISDFEQRSGKFDVHYNSEKQDHELAYLETTTDRMNIIGDAGVESFNSKGELEQWQYVGSYALAESLSFVFGADYRTDSFTNRQSEESFERDQKGVFVEGQVSFDNTFFYTVGARYDDNDDFGEHTSYRLTAAYLVPLEDSEVKLKGSYGTGFRAPSLYEIAYNNGAFAAPYVPRSFTEESSEGYELGAEWHFAPNTFLELVWFDNRIEDEIFFDMVGFGGYLQASGETRSSGVELVGSIEPVDNLVLSANYTYNDTELSSNTDLSGANPGDQRRRRPKHVYNASIMYSFWQDRIDLGAFYRSSRDAVDYAFGEGQVALEDYDVLDITGSWAVTDALEAYLRWENVLDEEYQPIAGYNASGSAGYLGLRASF